MQEQVRLIALDMILKKAKQQDTNCLGREAFLDKERMTWWIEACCGRVVR